MDTDEPGCLLNEALSVLIRGYPWLNLSSFGVARSHASQAGKALEKAARFDRVVLPEAGGRAPGWRRPGPLADL